MSGISFVLNLAKNALYAQQQGINVTAHNIANVNTEGYSRQQVNLDSLSPDTSARVKLGLGVIADSVYQNYDRFVTQNLLLKESALREYETKSSTLSYIQGLFNDSAGNGLSQALNEFWNGWQDLADNPGSLPERTALLQKAEALAERFHTIRNDLGRIQIEVGNSLGASLKELNSLTGRVAELNQKIVASESSGTAANDLRDQRTALLKQISGFIEGTVYNNADGSTTFVTSNGLLLMDRASNWTLSLHGNEIWWNENTVDISSRLTGGKIGGQLDLRDEILPQYTANVDELAGTLIERVNAYHYSGVTLSGETGKYFFENFKPVPETPNAVNYTGAAAYIRLSTSDPGDHRVIVGQNPWFADAALTTRATAATAWADLYYYDSLTGTGASAGLANGDAIVYSGTDRSGNPVSGTYTIPDITTGTVQDWLTALETTFGGQVTASIDGNGRIAVTDDLGGPSLLTLTITPVKNLDFGTLAGVNQDMRDHPENIAAGLGDLGDLYPGSPGDNRNALNILSLQTDETATVRKWTYEDRQAGSAVVLTGSLDNYYRTLVGDMGTLTGDSQTQYDFSQTMINNLNDLRESVSGVNLDEELTELMQLQSAYKAAAKLVSTSDELYETILNMR